MAREVTTAREYEKLAFERGDISCVTVHEECDL